jgi:hypothetical protein
VTGIFEIGSHEPFSPGWLQTVNLLISASWVAKLTAVSHQHPAVSPSSHRFDCVYLFIYFPLLLCCVGVHCDICEGSYGVSNM